jgi:RimJ/RimL family protein N-acetyltransferase
MNLTFEEFSLKETKLMIDWLSSDIWPYHIYLRLSKKQVQKWISEGKFVGEDSRTFWITLDNRERIGMIRLYDLTNKLVLVYQFDIRVRSQFRGQGIGEKAVVWLTNYVFTKMPEAIGLMGEMRQDNYAMRKILYRCGYIKEGHLRECWPTEGDTYVDTVVYTILREDWEQKKVTSVNWVDENVKGVDNIDLRHRGSEKDADGMSLIFPQFSLEETELMADWLSSDTWPYHIYPKLSREQILEWLKKGKFIGGDKIAFWIILNDKERVGMMRLMDLNDPLPYSPTIDIRIHTSYRGKGIGKQAIRWLTNYVFTKMPEKIRIEGYTRHNNVAMRIVFRKCGYIKEGHYRRRKNQLQKDTYYDIIGYGITRKDWEQKKITPVNWHDEDF